MWANDSETGSSSRCFVPVQEMWYATATVTLYRHQNTWVSAMLKIPCTNTVCRYLNTVPTGKIHDDHVWDVNRKLAAGDLKINI